MWHSCRIAVSNARDQSNQLPLLAYSLFLSSLIRNCTKMYHGKTTMEPAMPLWTASTLDILMMAGRKDRNAPKQVTFTYGQTPKYNKVGERGPDEIRTRKVP